MRVFFEVWLGCGQKESLGEYGSGWGWDSNMPHVLNQESSESTPLVFENLNLTNIPIIEKEIGINYGKPSSKTSSKTCNIEYTDGNLLFNRGQMLNQMSCIPHTYNAGNYYNSRAGSVNGDIPAKNSICSKGWKLAEKGTYSDYDYLLRINGIIITSRDRIENTATLIGLPYSYIFGGVYYYTGYKGWFESGLAYLTAFNSVLFFGGNTPLSIRDINNAYGYSLRCIAESL